jgi:hypothetical protein
MNWSGKHRAPNRGGVLRTLDERSGMIGSKPFLTFAVAGVDNLEVTDTLWCLAYDAPGA